MTRRVRYWFGFGNLLIAGILATADYAIPRNSLWLDLPLAALVLLLWIGGLGALFRQTWATRLIRVSAIGLLAFGLLSIAVLALTTAFLFGVHGHFLRDGVELVVIGFALLVPYALIYPLLVLATTTRAGTGSRR